jgi:hypothetical protein
VDAGFGLEIAVGVVAFHRESNALDAGFLARLIFQDLFPIAAAVRPAEIQAQQYLRPVLRFSSTGTRVKSYNRISSVVGPAKELRKFGLGHPLRHLGDLRGGFAERLFALLVFRYIEKEPRFFKSRSIFFPGVYDIFEGGLLFENTLGLFAVVPEIRLGSDLV